ncbi:MAG: VanZ family protein, partial [bacterium]
MTTFKTHSSHHPHGPVLARTMAFLVLAIILGATLYPFDFTADGYQNRVDAAMSQRFTVSASMSDYIVTNIILFMPLGFVLAFLARRRFGFFKAMFIVVLAGTVLSSSVEFLQLFLPFRYTSFIDVYSNAAGTLVGFLLHPLLGKKFSQHITEAVTQPNNRSALLWLGISYFTYAAFVFLLTISLVMSVRLNEWSKTFPLTIGNIQTGDRPWTGTINRVAFSKIAVNKTNVAQTLQEQRLVVPDKTFLVGDFDFRSQNGLKDKARNLPPLTDRGKEIPTQKTIFSATHWLETTGTAQNL